MKRLLLLIGTSFIFLSSFSQDKEKEAQYYFTKAETSYNEGKYIEAFNALLECENILGKPNSKILYLRIKSSNGAYKERPDSLVVNNIKFDITAFFKVTNADTYPADKYFEIIDLKKYYSEIDETKEDWKVFRMRYKLLALSEANKNDELIAEFEKCCKSDINLSDDFTKYVIVTIVMNTSIKLSHLKEQPEELEEFLNNLDLITSILGEFPKQKITSFSEKSIAENIGYMYIFYRGLFFIDEIGAKSKKSNSSETIKTPIRQALIDLKNTISNLGLDKVDFFISDTKYYHYYDDKLKDKDAYKNLEGKNSGTTTLANLLPFVNLK